MLRQGWHGAREPCCDGWLFCGVAVVTVCDVWARARARAVGGVRIAIVRGHGFVVVIEIVIIRTREALQIRGRVSPSFDTHDRRGGGGVSGGDEASITVIQDEVQVVLQQRSCARVRAEQEGTALGFARRLSLGHVMVIMVAVGEVQDDRGSVPSGGDPSRERVRARHDNGTRVGNGGISIWGAPVQGLCGSC